MSYESSTTKIRKTLRRFTNVRDQLGNISQIDLSDAGFDIVLIHFFLHNISREIIPQVGEMQTRQTINVHKNDIIYTSITK